MLFFPEGNAERFYWRQNSAWIGGEVSFGSGFHSRVLKNSLFLERSRLHYHKVTVDENTSFREQWRTIIFHYARQNHAMGQEIFRFLLFFAYFYLTCPRLISCAVHNEMFLTRYFIISPLNRYSLRLEAMLQKEEFQLTLETIEPSIEALQGAIKGVHNLAIEIEK